MAVEEEVLHQEGVKDWEVLQIVSAQNAEKKHHIQEVSPVLISNVQNAILQWPESFADRK